jgi:23S rRNA (adenine2503-C2)-methyltransferase
VNQTITEIFEKNIDGYVIRILNILLKADGFTKKQIISVPSQIGCNNQCGFCISKDQPLIRNLKSHEILELINLVPKEDTEIEISFTGEGEPLHNIKNINIVLDQLKKDCSIKSIKIAFSGLGSHLFSKINSQIPITLQFSLHQANEEKRKSLIPLSDGLDTIKENLKKHENKFERINLNYVLMEGKNNSPEDLSLLESYVEGTNWHILFNPLMTIDGLKVTEIDQPIKHQKIKLYKKIGESIVDNDLYKKLTYTKQ